MSTKPTTLGDFDAVIEEEARQRGASCTSEAIAADRQKAEAEFASLDRQGLLDEGGDDLYGGPGRLKPDRGCTDGRWK